jgi:8-oxo-dGTP pyrophosphatase MutT (NUDIX family)
VTEQSSAPARPAATVVLARDASGGGIEVYLIERQRSMGFMGGMHVFPGGKVADADASAQIAARIADAAEGARAEAWGGDLDAQEVLARAVAAIRETFEEAGVLLGIGACGIDLGRLRARLLAGDALAALLQEAGLVLHLAALQPLARWVTPEREPVRFDTSFFLARAPHDQSAEHDRKEAASGVWLGPRAALEASAAGRIRLAPPTARTLETLCETPSVERALAQARSAAPKLIAPIIRELGDQLVLLLPGDPEHPVRERALPGPTRQVLRRLR